MTTLTTPEDLAYQATSMMGDAAVTTLKRKGVIALAVAAMSLGAVYLIPQGLMAGLALMTTYSLWDLKKSRDDTKTLRDAFNMVSDGLSGHDSLYQMEPLKKVCDKIKGFSKDDLNVVDHFNRDKISVMFLGMMALMAPILAPLALANLVAMRDRLTLREIKAAADQSKINLQKKYPDRFPPAL